TLRGGYRAEASDTAYNNACACNWASTDASNKGSGLGSLYAAADSGRFAQDAGVPDIDIVRACCETATGITAQGDVSAGGVVSERKRTDGRVVGADCVATERIQTVGRVVAAACVVLESTQTVGRVAVAPCVAKERINTVGRVVAAVHISNERIYAAGGIPS